MKKISRRSMIMGGLAAVVLASSPLQVSAKSVGKTTNNRSYTEGSKYLKKQLKEAEEFTVNTEQIKKDRIYIEKECSVISNKLANSKQRYLLDYLPTIKSTLIRYSERDATFPDRGAIPQEYKDPSLYMAIIAYQLGRDPKTELVKKGKNKGKKIESNAYLYDPMKLSRDGMWTLRKHRLKSVNKLNSITYIQGKNFLNLREYTKVHIKTHRKYPSGMPYIIKKKPVDGKIDYSDKYFQKIGAIDEGIKWVIEESAKKIKQVKGRKVKYTFKEGDYFYKLRHNKNIYKMLGEDKKFKSIRDEDVIPGKTVVLVQRRYKVTYEPSVRKTLEKMHHQDGDKFVDGVLKLQAQLKSKK